MLRIAGLWLAVWVGVVGLRGAAPGWSWQVQLLPESSLYAVSAPDTNTIVTVGNGGRILRSTDGGVTWQSQNGGTNNSLISVSFTDANTGSAVGPGGTILRTTDGGETWASQWNDNSWNFYGVYFTDANTGTTVADRGRILRTTDGGKN